MVSLFTAPQVLQETDADSCGDSGGATAQTFVAEVQSSPVDSAVPPRATICRCSFQTLRPFARSVGVQRRHLFSSRSPVTLGRLPSARVQRLIAPWPFVCFRRPRRLGALADTGCSNLYRSPMHPSVCAPATGAQPGATVNGRHNGGPSGERTSFLSAGRQNEGTIGLTWYDPDAAPLLPDSSRTVADAADNS